jgi:hypothetical protein
MEIGVKQGASRSGPLLDRIGICTTPNLPVLTHPVKELFSEMSLAKLENYHGNLICPRCSRAVAVERDVVWCTSTACPNSDVPFQIIAGLPALIDFEQSVVSAEQLVQEAGVAHIPLGGKGSRLRRRFGNILLPILLPTSLDYSRDSGMRLPVSA